MGANGGYIMLDENLVGAIIGAGLGGISSVDYPGAYQYMKKVITTGKTAFAKCKTPISFSGVFSMADLAQEGIIASNVFGSVTFIVSVREDHPDIINIARI